MVSFLKDRITINLNLRSLVLAINILPLGQYSHASTSNNISILLNIVEKIHTEMVNLIGISVMVNVKTKVYFFNLNEYRQYSK